MDKYKTISTLGDGAFGTVYKATNIKTGQIVAIKKMKQKYSNWNQCIQLREIKSLRKLNHQKIIKLKQVLLVSQELYMVFEYLEYNLYEVYSRMKEKNKTFTQRQIKSIVFQILQGLAHMHKNGFFHRDMKPQNLLTYNNITKICDMGLARQIRSRPPFTQYVSTRWYRAPQLLLRSTNYNSPVDIFALGCIMAQLYTLCPLFAGNNEIDQLNKIIKIMGTPDKNDWPQGYKLAQSMKYYFPKQKGVDLSQIIPNASLQAIDLMQSMLKYSSRKRPTANQILKHEYFKDVIIHKDQNSLDKQIVFEQKPQGQKLNTTNQDKKMDEFRKTKQIWKQTRKNQALESNAFQKSKLKNKEQKGNQLVDLDSLIQQLQNKEKKKQSLPQLTTRKKFNERTQKRLRQSKTQMNHAQHYLSSDLQERKLYHSPKLIKQKKLVNKNKQIKPPSKSQMTNNKFSYSFQPNLNPALNNLKNNNTHSVKAMNYAGLGYKPLTQIKSQLKPLNLYKS